MENICKIDGCDNIVYGKGVCSKHYTRFRRHGNYDKPINKRGKLINIGKSYCCICGETKDVKEFNKDKQSFYGISKRCKMCSKIKGKNRYLKDKPKYQNYALNKKYNITLEDYNNMLISQNHKCAICGIMANDNKNLAVDHCHDTGNIRGLLCNKCNIGLGYFDDNQETLNNAIKYLNNAKLYKAQISKI